MHVHTLWSGTARKRARKLTTTLTILSVLALAVGTASTTLADSGTGCDFAQNGADACAGPLTGSTFAGGDGNLLANPTDFGSTDWENVTGLNKGIDLPSGTGDNAFGQGTKEDNPNVSVVDGSIPPNKSDLIRFYEASEFANGNNYLYLAWERTNVLGSANFDFEINQKTQPDLTQPGPATLNRTAGDLLVTYDFTNGGGKPTIGLLTWVTSGSTSQCFSSNSLPCWGNEKTLGTSTAIAAVNTDTVTDPIAPNAPRSLPGLTFGETAINLTDAGVFPAGTCEAFGSAFVRSRSSASFTAEIKDFIAPIPVNISNCGSIKIIKQTDPRGLDQVFSFTSNLPAEPAGTVNGVPQGGVACTAGGTAGVQSNGTFCLNDKGNSGKTLGSTDSAQNSAGNTVYNNALVASTYTVTEGATDPTGFAFESLSCTGGTTSTNGKTATITLAPNDQVVCLYINQGSGAIQISKTGKDKNCTAANTPTITNGTCTGAGTAELSGAKFTVNGEQKSTNAKGQACFDGLTIGTKYTVTEDTPPNGYAIDTSSKDVTVSKAATCTSGTPDSVGFNDLPLTNISAGATSVVAGATNSTIVCKDSGGNVVASSGSAADPASAQTTNGLIPGTYTCTIVIDP